MKEVNMKPEEIANLVVLSREKGYAIIIPQDALYLVSKAFQKQLAQCDAQIAALTADNRNYSELLQYHIDRQAKTESQIAALEKQEPVGELHCDISDKNFPCVEFDSHDYSKLPSDGTVKVFTRAAPPAPFVGSRTMPRHEFAQMVNELRDVPAVQSKREKIVSILHTFNINPAGGSVADE